MKLVKFLSLSAFAALLALAPLASEEYLIDVEHSAMLFSVQHMGLGNTWGRFNDFSGVIKFDAKDLEHSMVEVTVQVASVDTHSKKRDAHLRNTDIFDAGTFPTMTFVGKGFKAAGDNAYEVEGTINIRGKEQSLKLKLVKIGEGIHVKLKKPAIGFEAEFEIDRTAFGVGEGDVSAALGKSVRIIVALEAVGK